MLEPAYWTSYTQFQDEDTEAPIKISAQCCTGSKLGPKHLDLVCKITRPVVHSLNQGPWYLVHDGYLGEKKSALKGECPLAGYSKETHTRLLNRYSWFPLWSLVF